MCLRQIKTKVRGRWKKIDLCLVTTVHSLNAEGYKTILCCCGHGIFHKTIIVEFEGKIFEWFSKVEFPKKKRAYYTLQKKIGLYYIKEVENHYIKVQETK